jgi:hypothetical protein
MSFFNQAVWQKTSMGLAKQYGMYGKRLYIVAPWLSWQKTIMDLFKLWRSESYQFRTLWQKPPFNSLIKDVKQFRTWQIS